MDDKLATAVDELSHALDAKPDKSNVAFALYETMGVADNRVNISEVVHVLLAKRNDLLKGAIGNCAFTGPLNTDNLPPYITYLGKSTFAHAQRIFGERNG